MEHREGTTRIGRREAVKKAAVVGAAAWSAPMILSSKVSAAGGTCPDPDTCPTPYFVKVDVESGNCDGNPMSQDAPPWECAAHVIQSGVQYQSGCAFISVSGDENNYTITLPPTFRVAGVVWFGGGQCQGSSGVSISGPCNNIVNVAKGQGQPGISNVSLTFCGP